MLPEEQLMRGQSVLLADSEDLWDEQYQIEVSTVYHKRQKFRRRTLMRYIGFIHNVVETFVFLLK